MVANLISVISLDGLVWLSGSYLIFEKFHYTMLTQDISWNLYGLYYDTKPDNYALQHPNVNIPIMKTI